MRGKYVDNINGLFLFILFLPSASLGLICILSPIAGVPRRIPIPPSGPVLPIVIIVPLRLIPKSRSRRHCRTNTNKTLSVLRNKTVILDPSESHGT